MSLEVQSRWAEQDAAAGKRQFARGRATPLPPEPQPPGRKPPGPPKPPQRD